MSIHFNISTVQELCKHKSMWCWLDLQHWICVCNWLNSTQMKYAEMLRKELENVCISGKKKVNLKITEKRKVQ